MQPQRILLAIAVPLLLAPLLQGCSRAGNAKTVDKETFMQFLRKDKLQKCTIHGSPGERVKVSCVAEIDTGRQRLRGKFLFTNNLMQEMEEHGVATEMVMGTPLFPMIFWGLTILIAVLSLLGFGFWLWMLADCLQREHPGENDKLLWVLVIIFTHLIGAFLYLFIQRERASLPAENRNAQP